MGQQCSCLSGRKRKASHYGRRFSDDDDDDTLDGFDNDDSSLQTIDILIEAPLSPRTEQREQQLGLLSALHAQELERERLDGSSVSVSTSLETTRLSLDASSVNSPTGNKSSLQTTISSDFELEKLQSLSKPLYQPKPPTPPPPPEATITDPLLSLHLYEQRTGIVFTPKGDKLDVECIMCLDTFSSDNPKVRTLCNCGMNRTNFHMSCLLEWLQRDATCPVCRAYLFYED